MKEKMGNENDMLARALAQLPSASEAIALYDEARQLIQKLQVLIEEYYSLDRTSFDRPLLSDILADANRGGLAWRLVIEKVPINFVDRRKPMLKGPLFITKDFPNPTTDDGKFMIPLIQVDLRELSAIRGLPLGDGLLQAWVDESVHCRVIPRQVVDDQEPIPFPTRIDQFNEHGQFYIKNWMTGERSGKTLEDGERVVPMLLGYRDPFICIDLKCIDDLSWDGFIEECSMAIADSPEPHEYTRLMQILQKLDNDHPGGDHAFGSFHHIHQSAKDLQSEEVLFVFESDNFFWGDAGNVHIMYDFQEGNPVFWAVWASC